MSLPLVSLNSFAGDNRSIQYQARILDPSGKPFEGNATFQFTIRAPNGCVLWSENQSVNMSGTKGALSVEIGGSSSTNLAAGSLTFQDIFMSTGTALTGLTGCSLGTSYTPLASHDRTLMVTFNDGTNVNSLPALAIKAVPFAHFAHLAEVSKFALGLGTKEVDAPTPGNGDFLRFNGTKWVPASLPAGGSVTSVNVTGNSIFDITGGPITLAGTINLGLASQNQNLVFAAPVTGAGSPSFRALASSDIPTLDASKIGAGTLAASLIPALNASKITSGTLSAAVGGTGLSPAAGDANKVFAVNAAGTGTEFKSLVQGSGISVDTSVAGQITIAATNSGSVTNVGLTMPSIFSVANSPVTGAGTMNVTLANAAQNAVFAGPASGGAGTPSFRALAASDIPSLDASKITTGTLATAVLGTIPASIVNGTLASAAIGDIDASQITTGTFASARLGVVDASIVTTGTFALARLGTIPSSMISGTLATSTIGNIDASQVTTGTLATAIVGNLPASTITTGTFASARLGVVDASIVTTGTFATARLGLIPASIVDGTLATAAVGNLDASQITSGTFATARLGVVDASIVATGTFATARLGLVPASIVDGTLATSALGNLDASQITTGTFATARLGVFDASLVTTGTFALARLGTIPASMISGTLATAAMGITPAANGGTGLDGSSAGNGTLLIGNGTGYTLATLNVSNGMTQTLGAGTISLTTNATNNNTASAIVARDPSGNFSAGAIDMASAALRGSTTGVLTLNTPASFTNYTMTLPGSIGTPGQVLRTDGTSATSWITLPASQWSNSAAGIYFNSGSVAIGRNNAAAALDVNGTLRVTQICDESGSNCKTVSGGWGAGGSVTNVGLTGNSIFNITGSSVSTAGTFNVDLASQNQNLILASPASGSGTPSFRALASADVPSLSASKITSGTLNTAQIGVLDASIITTGTLATARLGVMDASLIATGTLATARLGTIPASIVSGTLATSAIGDLDASQVTTGTFATARLGQIPTSILNGTLATATVGNLPASAITTGTLSTAVIGNLPASAITTGTLATARLGVMDASIITTGTFATARLGTIPASIISGTLATAAIGNIDASQITTGTFATARIPDLDAGKITTGTFATARLGVMDAAIITTGTFATARLGQIPASIVSGTLATASMGIIPAANGGTGLNGGSAANGRLLVGNGSGFTLATLNISNGLSQTLGAGSVSLTTNATNLNTASAIVARDPSGNFSAGAVDVASIGIRGSTSGVLTMNMPSTFTNFTMTFPSSIGSTGQVLRTDGTSALSWVNVLGDGSTFKAASGDVNDPGLTFNSDPDTGLWNPGANTLAISTAGSERMRIDSGGNVGIGTTTPQAALDVNGSVKVGNDATCNGNKKGAIRHNGTTFEGCDGITWVEFNFTAASHPVGTVITSALATCPGGFVAADGSAISRATYATLFAAMGTIYGAGDGSTTFNLPDYRGEFLRGWANGSANDPDRASRTDRGDGTTGDNVGTKQAGANASHTHGNGTLAGTTDTHAGHTHGVGTLGGTADSGGAHTHGPGTLTGTAASAGAHTHTFTDNTAVAGGTNSFENDGSTAVTAISQTSAGDTTASSGAHTHAVTVDGGATASGGAHTHTLSLSGATASAGSHSHSVTITGAIASQGGNEARPRNVNVLYCIKY